MIKEILCFGAGVLVGYAAKLALSEVPEKDLKPIGELLKDQYVTEHLDGSCFGGWFRSRMRENAECVICHATAEHLRMLGYACPKEFQQQQYLLQAVYDTKESRTLAIRLINYVTSSQEIQRLLHESGMAVIDMQASEKNG